MAAQAAAGEAQGARTAAPPPDEPDWLAEGTAAHGKARRPNLACCRIASHGEPGVMRCIVPRALCQTSQPAACCYKIVKSFVLSNSKLTCVGARPHPLPTAARWPTERQPDRSRASAHTRPAGRRRARLHCSSTCRCVAVHDALCAMHA